MDAKLGVYICSGCGIGEVVDTDELQNLGSGELKADECIVDPLVCGEKCIDKIKADITDKGLNRVVIAGCSPRYFAETFNFGPDVLVDRVPLREYVAWMQQPEDDEEKDEAQLLAGDYIKMSAAKMRASEPPEPFKEEISKDILVIGGGVSGMSAAISAADAGYNVVLVEKSPALGGWASKFKWVFPSEPPYEKPTAPPTGEMIKAVEDHPKIKVYLSSKVSKTSGQPGQFDVSIKTESGTEKIRIGSIVQATGWKPYDPNRLEKYGYGKFKNVVTNVELEEMVSNGGIARKSDGKAPKSVAIIHCAGSRDKEFLPYCSAVCCRAALKQALYIREQIPDADVFLLYKDIRSPGVYEQFYAAVQQNEGIFLTKGEVVDVAEKDSDHLTVQLDETLLGESITVEADMLVLAAGMVPTTLVENGVVEDAEQEEQAAAPADGKKAAASAEAGAKIINLTYRKGTDLPTLKYGFPDSHFICFPYETQRTGIYASGTVRAPMDIPTARTDGMGAALKAIQVLESIQRGEAVHPRAGDISFPDFFMQRCTQCKRCTEECPFGTLDEDDKGTPLPNPLRCRRCGICMGACPERIISFKNYSPNMVSQMIKSIEIPEEDEEKPRLLAFMCENDAVPALDIAAMHRHKLTPTIRIVPVRCIGSVNTVWIADALSAGFDGILLLGCQRGDDYQCHYVKGSELANTRMENVQEKLQQLVLERERVKIDVVELSDWNKVAGIINDFAEEVIELGPNPYKEF